MRKLFLGLLVIVLSAVFVEASVASFYFNVDGNDSDQTFSEILRSQGVVFQVTTSEPAVCKYSSYEGTSFANMEGDFDFSFETIHKKDFVDLSDGPYTYYVMCKDEDENYSGELEASFAVRLPVSAEIVLEDGETVSTGRTEILVRTSKALSQAPSLSYSFDGVSYDPVPLFGSGNEWNGYLMIASSNEEVTGTFKFEGRDLEGVLGREITNGGTFFVDTKKPRPISDIKAVGYEGEIKLNWEIDEDDIKEYKIYRAKEPGIGYSDYFKKTEEDEFTDSLVEKGDTYYYRVAGVDNAGNIADLSKEVYATVLLRNVTTSSGLDLRYHGLVDNLIIEIENVLSMADDMRENFESKDGKEGELYEMLRLEREINGAKSELNALKRETENYKSQSLSRSELDKRLNSGQLKLNTIKRKIPESLVIVSEKSEERGVNENDVTTLILRLWPDISESLKEKRVEASLELMEENGFEVKTEAYNLEVVFMDGSRREMALVREDVEFDHGINDSVYVLESVPEGIANSVSDLSIKNVDYDVVKEDTIISFSANSGEILYTLDDHIDMDALRGIRTLALFEVEEEVGEGSSLSGYFSFVDLESGGDYAGVIFAVLVIAGLGGYLFYMRRTSKVSEKLVPLRQIMDDAESSLRGGRHDMAKDFYHAASLHYKSLEKKLQKAIYSELENLHRRIAGGVR